MNYKETLEYLYAQLPMFTRIGASAYKADLVNTIRLCENLGNPQHTFKSIHIAGTNGKGSTSHMLAAVLQTAGYKTGLYTSPHLNDFRERIRMNGQMISEEKVIEFVTRHQQSFNEIKPSFFEMTVALAFDVFSNEKADIAVIETGLGGRLDSTNIISPMLSVITNIGWDHMNILGDTLQLIAAEKAGIIKPHTPVIIGEYQPEVAGVFIEKAKQQQSGLTFASEMWSETVKSKRQMAKDNAIEMLDLEITYNSNISQPAAHAPFIYHLQLDLTGTYQLKNLKTVLSAINELRKQGFHITDEHVRTALRQVKTLTGLHGRWEVISRKPLTICDTGHNPEGIKEVLNNIASVDHRQLHFVIGMVNDKDINGILSLLPDSAIYYFCRPDIPRGLEAGSLKLAAGAFKLNGEVYPSVNAALMAARENAGVDDLVFIGGSTFVVAEVIPG